MTEIANGDLAPAVMGVDQNGKPVRLSNYRSRPVVIFFYPADSSPVCRMEACDFRDAYQNFTDAGAVVIGVSSDRVESHSGFAKPDNHSVT